jgi:hypothetical protein
MKKSVPEPASKSSRLVIGRRPKQTPEAALAELVVAGLAINAVTALQFSKPFTDVDLTECLKALVSAAERVKRGDLAEAEAPGRRRTPTKLNPDSSAYLFRNRKRLTTAKIRRYPSIGQRLTDRPIRRSKSLNRGSGRRESNSGSTASQPSRLARA